MGQSQAPIQANVLDYSRTMGKTDAATFQADLAPFYHGVASGDPLQDRVIIWTRVSDTEEAIEVEWRVGTDPELTDIVQHGKIMTDASKDYTVKIDVEGLEAGTTYYYGFTAMDKHSLTGRTKTASADSEHLRFGITSCSNYQGGYFHAYRYLSERNDLDAVIHLGDYYYEYKPGQYGPGEGIGRGGVLPDKEIVEVEDYRMRHSFYKLDPDLMAVHQQHPFIVIWDDHEVANDSYKDGAQNHNPGEGEWPTRVSNSKKAYFEWMPIRDNEGQKVYRKIDYGTLADLILLDTRIEGRDQQVESVSDSAYLDPNRTILGETQRNWFTDHLSNSEAQWKLVGNQVIFAPIDFEQMINVSAAAEILAVDIWTGYPFEQQNMVDYIADNNIENVAFLTGDIHVTFAFDVAKDLETYDAETGEGSVAVEFVTPSISSDGFDELLGETTAGLFEDLMVSFNPQTKKINFFDHGYYVLDVTPDKLQGDWYYMSTVHEDEATEAHGMGVFTAAGENHLQATETESEGKAEQELPAPDEPPLFNGYVGLDQINALQKDLSILAVYPNPVSTTASVSYALNNTLDLGIALYDLTGKKIAHLFQDQQSAGIYQLQFDAQQLNAGIYVIQFETEKGNMSKRILVK